MADDFAQNARDILKNNKYISVATADDDGPWIVPLHFSYEKGVITWESFPQTKHSEQLKDNPKIGFLVYDSSEDDTSAQALYGRAAVESVSDPNEIGRCTYTAKVTELWLQPIRVVDCEHLPRQPLDPATV
mgnify:CR=1 FL=1